MANKLRVLVYYWTCKAMFYTIFSYIFVKLRSRYIPATVTKHWLVRNPALLERGIFVVFICWFFIFLTVLSVCLCVTRVIASSFHHYNALETGNYCQENITFSRNVFLSNHQGKYKSFRLNTKQLRLMLAHFCRLIFQL